MTQHRCAVCWQFQSTHDEWYRHATTTHGAVLDEFGYRECDRHRVCPGEDHVRLAREGMPPVRRVRPPMREFVFPDGTKYEQVEMGL